MASTGYTRPGSADPWQTKPNHWRDALPDHSVGLPAYSVRSALTVESIRQQSGSYICIQTARCMLAVRFMTMDVKAGLLSPT